MLCRTWCYTGHCKHPHTRERFFYEDASLPPPTHPSTPCLHPWFTQRQQEVWAYCLVLERDGKLFGAETKPGMFYLGDTCWLDLSISASELSHIGIKRSTLKCVRCLDYQEKLLGGRTEYCPYRGKAAVLFKKVRVFFSLGVAGHEMHFEATEFLGFLFS